jgi:hypothetical protein
MHIAFLVDIAALFVVFVAIVRIVMTPTALWAHGKASKAAWVIATVWFVPVVHGAGLPFAAAVAIWYTRRLTRQQKLGEPPPLPVAEGTPEPEVTEERR